MAAKLSDPVGRGNALALLGQDRTKLSKHARAIHKMIGHTGTTLMEDRMFSLAGVIAASGAMLAIAIAAMCLAMPRSL
jgi:hypothetical protein